MAKQFEELAAEMTIAWINAVGQACTSGKFASDWLEAETVSKTYSNFVKTIYNDYKSSPDQS